MLLGKKKRVFLDYASTTPIDDEVSLSMKKSEIFFANPSSLYGDALMSKEIINESRKNIASILATEKSNIVFTSGGTESNNLAILGIFRAFKKDSFVPHFITTKIEHPSVLEVFKEVERLGGEVTYLDVTEEGLLKTSSVRDAIKENTVLVSVMYANNEIGTIQPIKEISRVIKDYRNQKEKDFPYLHTDASQASLYLNLNTLELGVDLLTLDGIKMYGPRGFGILFVKKYTQIREILFGGGQENGLRSGTENLPSIVGFAKALEIAEKHKESESKRLSGLRDYAIKEISKNFPMAILNGSQENRLPNNINFCFPGIDAEFAVVSLDVLGVSASYSSSCRTLKEDSSSYVVESLGRPQCKESSLRFTLGRESKKVDIDFLVECLKKVLKK